MCILQCLCGIVYRPLFSSFDLWYHLTLMFLCWYFWSGWLADWWNWANKITYSDCDRLPCAFLPIVFTLLSCVHQWPLSTCLELWWSLKDCFLNQHKRPYLFLLPNFLLDISIEASFYFLVLFVGNILFHPSFPRLYLFYLVRHLYCR